MNLMLLDWTTWSRSDVLVSLVPLVCIPAYFLWRASRRSGSSLVRGIGSPLLPIAIGSFFLLLLVVILNVTQPPPEAVQNVTHFLGQLANRLKVSEWVWITSFGILAILGFYLQYFPLTATAPARVTPNVERIQRRLGRARDAVSVVGTTLAVITLLPIGAPGLGPSANQLARYQYETALAEQFHADGQVMAANALLQNINQISPDDLARLRTLLVSIENDSRSVDRAQSEGARQARSVFRGLSESDLHSKDQIGKPSEESIFEKPVKSPVDLEGRLALVVQERKTANTAESQVNPAIEALSTALVGLLFTTPGLVVGEDERKKLIDITQEFLSPIVEYGSSHLFTSLARLTHLDRSAPEITAEFQRVETLSPDLVTQTTIPPASVRLVDPKLLTAIRSARGDLQPNDSFNRWFVNRVQEETDPARRAVER